MICSYLHNDKYSFISLHAEQSYSNVELYKRYSLEFNNNLKLKNFEERTNEDTNERKIENIDFGVFGKKLTIKTLKKLYNFISSEKFDEPYMVLDFNRLYNLQKNIYKKFHEILSSLLDKKLCVILFNLSEPLNKQLKLDDFTDLLRFKTNNHFYAYSKSEILESKNITSVTDILYQEIFEWQLLQKVGLLSPALEKELNPSSSVYINKFINVKNLDENKEFLSYCIYKLAILMLSYNNADLGTDSVYKINSERISLFSQTLNGAYIASALSDLMHLDTTFVDHIGPINKLYNSYFGEIIDINRKYIVVSDVVCLGTETKTAKSLIEHSGGIYLGNVSFFRAKTINSADKKFTDVVTLFEINKANDLKYKINFKITADLV